MRTLGIFIFLIALPFHGFTQDHQIDTREIERVQRGDYSFAKGEVQVTFVDTVSKAFVEEQLSLLGYEVLSLNVRPIFAWVEGNPTQKELQELEKDPRVNSISVEQFNMGKNNILQMIEEDSLSDEERKKEIERIRESWNHKITRLIFQFSVDKKEAQSFINDYPEFDLRLNMISPKNAVIKTKVGQEEQAMEALNRLIYVKNTAYIALME